ncbi:MULTISPECIES: hypothetical protein [Bradyrhizobium]|uniref:hypothetical protein n=1 Tax=Bradyrhizobium TaxID=374 RepID=UPI0012EC64CB|nr:MULTISPECIES: hypothetical protein [Bradyrhizobium]QOG22453.1 hypothetical protein FOM02_39410 [Bradyrhizobium sp. SEMIA]UFW45860.1 hypothetical protein BaraCB756_26480 [Bradyrhizobium arachidis]
MDSLADVRPAHTKVETAISTRFNTSIVSLMRMMSALPGKLLRGGSNRAGCATGASRRGAAETVLTAILACVAPIFTAILPGIASVFPAIASPFTPILTPFHAGRLGFCLRRRQCRRKRDQPKRCRPSERRKSISPRNHLILLCNSSALFNSSLQAGRFGLI